MSNVDMTILNLFDKDWLSKHDIIKRDPYRFILSEKEYKQCYNRPKRIMFSSFIVGGYFYYSLRHKQELGLVKGLKLGQVFLLTTVPKALILGAISYFLGFSLFVNYDKKKCHNIAKIELMKFDESHFDRNNFHYVLSNSPIYPHEDSKFGEKKILRNFVNVHQVPGYIRRMREANSQIQKDIPPKYEFTPEGNRKINTDKINEIPNLLKY